ncbi:MAG: ferredoxin thioredoxin reductase catalytic beta chain [Lentisphaeria bacterium]|nr:ferredoxin thioredoxin reductase catalytic beta chain [Lentisphaeria bacterium]MBQ8756435.1 ferredoxin thioredoxin reductase catalytic beta chain [Lentisphaeria bacterium]MBQ9774992.1 ferredoxin thioredoxin reductase catalytic beta chain [Lentisphaeria bacterium]
MELPENVKCNPDPVYVEKLRSVMAKNGGYCPCRLQRIPENICICKEFQEQIADPDFKGYCHCRLYCKE